MQMQRELLLSLGISNIDNNATTTIAIAPATSNYVSFLRQLSSSSAKNHEVIANMNMTSGKWHISA
jgi:hypothetical protein